MEEHFGVGKFADVFHGQLALTRGASATLAMRIRHGKKELQKAMEKAPMDVPMHQKALSEAEEHKKQWRDVVCGVRISGVSQALHPFDLETGRSQSEEAATQKLTEVLEKGRALVVNAKLPHRAEKAIAKVMRLIPSMVSQLSFYHDYCAESVAELSLGLELTTLVHRVLLPGLYLRAVAGKARAAEQARELWTQAELWLSELTREGSPWQQLPADRKAAVLKVCNHCVQVFQRASSAVEGYNGKLSLFAMLWHQLPPARLRALTIVHNYWTKGEDGTTPAERLFGAPPQCLFTHLVEHVELPPRPAQRRPRKPRSEILLH